MSSGFWMFFGVGFISFMDLLSVVSDSSEVVLVFRSVVLPVLEMCSSSETSTTNSELIHSKGPLHHMFIFLWSQNWQCVGPRGLCLFNRCKNTTKSRRWLSNTLHYRAVVTCPFSRSCCNKPVVHVTMLLWPLVANLHPFLWTPVNTKHS